MAMSGDRGRVEPPSLAQILRQLAILVVVITVIVSATAYRLGVEGHLSIVLISAAVIVVLGVALGRERRGQPRVAARVAIAGIFVLSLSLMLLAPIASALAVVAPGYALGIVLALMFDTPKHVRLWGLAAATLWVVGLGGRFLIEPFDPGMGSGYFILPVVPAGLLLLCSRMAQAAIEYREAATEREKAVRKSLEETNSRLLDARDATIEAKDANRVKSAFLATMSHELRTPLNAILGYSEFVIEDHEDLPLEMASDVKRITAAGHQLLQLINDVLEISRIEAGRASYIAIWFGLHQHFDASLAEVAPFVASAAIDFRYNEAPEIGEMKSDAERLQLMIVNILRHFVVISEEGATVVLDVARRQRAEGEALIIEIKNRDLFLSKTQTKHFFEPFAWRDAGIEGAGGEIRLGLILARRICDLLGGTFVVRVDDGSTLEIALPIEPRQDADNVIYTDAERMGPEAG